MQAMPFDEGKAVDLAVLLLRRAVAIDFDDVERAAGQVLRRNPRYVSFQLLRSGGISAGILLAALHAATHALQPMQSVESYSMPDRMRRHLFGRPRDGANASVGAAAAAVARQTAIGQQMPAARARSWLGPLFRCVTGVFLAVAHLLEQHGAGADREAGHDSEHCSRTGARTGALGCVDLREGGWRRQSLDGG